MQLYIYAQTGHNYGLDKLKRACAIYEQLKDFDPIICTTDFRAGVFAKEVFGVNKYVSIDVIENLPNILERGDALIFESDEPTPTMKKHMGDFCGALFEVGIDIPKILTHTSLRKNCDNGKMILFFGDDDYEEVFAKLCRHAKQSDINLLLGHYYFLGNEELLSAKFANTYEDGEYINAICEHEFVLTASPQTAIEVAAAGNKPIFFCRQDKEQDEMNQILKELQIPTIKADTLDAIIIQAKDIASNYPTIKAIKQHDFTSIHQAINELSKEFSSFG